MDNKLLITGLEELGKRSRSIQKAKLTVKDKFVFKDEDKNASVYSNNQLPIILEKSKENFMKHMINEETKFANLGQIEDYYSSKIDKINEKYNVKADLIQKKKKLIEDIDQRIQIEIANANQIETDDITKYYDSVCKDLFKKM